MLAPFYIFAIVLLFVFIFFRHVYLLRFRFLKIMQDRHFDEWKNMMEDTSWLTPNWSSLYRTKAIHNFVWYSEEDYNDIDLRLLRKKLKMVVWEFIGAFVIVLTVTILLINLKILR